MVIYVDPGEPDWDEYEDYDEDFLKTLNRYELTDWKPLSFDKDGTKLSVQLKFDNPELVSRFRKRDKLVFVLSPWLSNHLRSTEGEVLEKYIASTSIRMKKIPGISPEEVAQMKEMSEHVQRASYAFFILSLIMDYFLPGMSVTGLRMSLLMLSLQMILYMAMLSVTMPGIMSIVYEIVIAISTFDLCEGRDICFSWFMDPNQENDLIPANISELGYSMTNTFLILGSNALILLVLLVYMLYCAVISICNR